jgi:tetratricopeptide (TPR) repeat protein
MSKRKDSTIQTDQTTLSIVEGFMASKAQPSLNNAHEYMERANALEEQGLLEQAKQDYNSAIILEPQEAKAWSGRGDINFKLANYEDAIKDYQQVG